MLIMLIAVMHFQEPTIYRITVSPKRLQNEDIPESYLTGIKAIDTDGTHIFIADSREPKVVQFKPDGTFVRMIGGRGRGPGELGLYGPHGMAVRGPSIWILTSRGGQANYYENGEFITSFKPWHYIRHGSGMPSYRFDFNEDTIVLPTFPVRKALARAYDYGGEGKQDIGKELPRQMEFLEVNPTLNNTMWEFDGEYWYALFFHRPLLRKFDRDFKLVNEFIIHGPEIDQFELKYVEAERDPNWTYPKPHFTDFTVFRNSVFAFSEGVLYQVDKENGKVVSRTIFLGKGEVKDHQTNGRLYFHRLLFLDSGQLIISNDFLFLENDVWFPDETPYWD